MTPCSAALLAVAVLLSGCVSVLPAGPPVQLYRFGADSVSPSSAPPAGAPGLVLTSITLPRAAAGGRPAGGDRRRGGLPRARALGLPRPPC